MTCWGPPIEMRGRPEWLVDDEVIVNATRPDAPWRVNPTQNWRGVKAIRLRTDHPRYKDPAA